VPTARVRDIDVYYEVHEPDATDDRSQTACPVLLISGTAADVRSDPNRHRHPLVRAGFTVAMYDQRGLGRTGKPDQGYSMADYALDAVGLLDHLGWRQAAVIGISFGGMVAQHVAIDHAERVHRLVLACTSSGGDGGSSADLLAVADLPEAKRQAESLRIMDARNDPTTDPVTIAPGLARVLSRMAEMRSLIADDPVAQRGARLQLLARAKHNTWEHLHHIAAPTFVMAGRFDLQAPAENAERLVSRIADAELAVFDGGHLFLIQDPTAWPAAIAFLQR
jgi:3-oxoadipate enol-lactonase